MATALAQARAWESAHDTKQVDNANAAAQRGFHFEPPLSVTDQVYRPYGTGRLYCVHAKAYFEPCSRCKRNKREADGHLERFMAKFGV